MMKHRVIVSFCSDTMVAYLFGLLMNSKLLLIQYYLNKRAFHYMTFTKKPP